MRRFSVVFLLVLLAAAGAFADTIVFNSFGPNQSINSGYETVNSLFPFTIGMKFTPASSVQLTSISAPWAVISGAGYGANSMLSVALLNDARMGQTRREYRLQDGVFAYSLDMSTTAVPAANRHVRAELRRTAEDDAAGSRKDPLHEQTAT